MRRGVELYLESCMKRQGHTKDTAAGYGSFKSEELRAVPYPNLQCHRIPEYETRKGSDFARQGSRE